MMIVIKAIETDDSSVYADSALGFVAVPASGSVVGPALNFVAGPVPNSIAGPVSSSVAVLTLYFVNVSAPCSITVPTPDNVTGRAFSMVINPKTTFFYSKQVTTENCISSKLYIKGTI